MIAISLQIILSPSIIVKYYALGRVSSQAMNNHDSGEYREKSHGSGTREEKQSP